MSAQTGNVATYHLTYLEEHPTSFREDMTGDLIETAKQFRGAGRVTGIMEGDSLTLIVILHTPYTEAGAMAEALLDELSMNGEPITGGLLRDAREREEV